MAAMSPIDRGASVALRAEATKPKVTGIANILLTEDGQYFGLQGDRAEIPEKALWASSWYPMDGVLEGAPYQVYLTKIPDDEGTNYVMCGQKYDWQSVAAAQLDHAIRKKWVPIFFGSLAEAHEAVKNPEGVVHAPETLKRFHDLMLEFTEMCKNFHNLELVMGGRFRGEKITDALKRETSEEAGWQLKPGDSKFIGNSEPFASRKTGEMCVTAIFLTRVNREEVEQAFEAALAERRPTGFEHECAHPFFKHLSGVDVKKAKAEKAGLEVTHGAFYPLAKFPHPNMDPKNLAIMKKVIQHLEHEASSSAQGVGVDRDESPQAPKKKQRVSDDESN